MTEEDAAVTSNRRCMISSVVSEAHHGVITNNRSYGVHGKAGTLTVESTMIASNNVGVQATASGTVRLSDTSIYNNLTGFGCGGGTLASAGNNRKAGNVGGVVPVCAPTVAITIQ